MNIVVFLNGLGLGGTEKAAVRWARGLASRGHILRVIALTDGPRRAEFEDVGLECRIVAPEPSSVAQALRDFGPHAIHAHAPGYPHAGDVLGAALALIPGKIPVVQTNIFGRLQNPAENQWTDFRLFICWTSAVQAARRSFHRLNCNFFRRSSVAAYPLDPDDGPNPEERSRFREMLGVMPDEILFGRLARPDPSKWLDLPVQAFRHALQSNSRLKLLLREPPPEIARQLRASPDRAHFLILPATSSSVELHQTMASLDAVLHASSIGESFGYGIAEPMNFAKPVIAHSVPWQDQAQIELVRHGECGWIASTVQSMATAILSLAGDKTHSARLGRRGQQHIRQIADPETSLDRLEGALRAVAEERENPRGPEDLAEAMAAAAYLDQQQFGHSLREQIALRPHYLRVRFHEWRQAVRQRFATGSISPKL